jgi:hypothetical protein
MDFFLLFKIKMNIIDPYSAWSLAEIEQFEEGLHEYGKNFFKISVFKVITMVYYFF